MALRGANTAVMCTVRGREVVRVRRLAGKEQALLEGTRAHPAPPHGPVARSRRRRSHGSSGSSPTRDERMQLVAHARSEQGAQLVNGIGETGRWAALLLYRPRSRRRRQSTRSRASRTVGCNSPVRTSRGFPSTCVSGANRPSSAIPKKSFSLRPSGGRLAACRHGSSAAGSLMASPASTAVETVRIAVRANGSDGGGDSHTAIVEFDRLGRGREAERDRRREAGSNQRTVPGRHPPVVTGRCRVIGHEVGDREAVQAGAADEAAHGLKIGVLPAIRRQRIRRPVAGGRGG